VSLQRVEERLPHIPKQKERMGNDSIELHFSTNIAESPEMY
jgi:hypothetical protein